MEKKARLVFLKSDETMKEVVVVGVEQRVGSRTEVLAGGSLWRRHLGFVGSKNGDGRRGVVTTGKGY